MEQNYDSQLNFQKLFEGSPDLYLVLMPDRQFSIIAVSEAYLKATMTKRKDIIGKGLFEIFPDNPEDPTASGTANLKASLKRVVQKKVPDAMAVQKYDIKKPESEGGGFEERFWSPVNTPVLDDNGNLKCIIHRVEDVTEFMRLKKNGAEQLRLNNTLKAASERMENEIYVRSQQLQDANVKLRASETRLKELDTLKSQFFANVSHELRTPLSLIIGPASQILRDQSLTEDVRANLNVILRNAETLLKHVNDLLDVARMEENKLKPMLVAGDLSKTLKFLMANFDSVAREKKIIFGSEMPPALTLQFDPNMISRVILNLLGNAFKFTPENGTIDVRLKEEKKVVTLEVEDSGPGIPPEYREIVFERFRQLDGGSARKFGGTGLGLSIAKEFVLLHGGSIRISDGKNGGAKFVVTLPCKTADMEVPFQPSAELKQIPVSAYVDRPNESVSVSKDKIASAKADAHDKKSLATTVLVVEDNRDLNLFLVGLLGSRYKVETAFDGEEGLKKALQFKPDLIVSDVMMPKMSGDDMLRELRKHPELDSTNVMLLTAKADDMSKLRLLEEGAQDYIVKPFLPEELLARANNLVMLKKAQDISNVETLLENALDAVIAMDARGCITQWNRQAEETFGWSKEEVIGQRMSEVIIPKPFREAHERGLKQFLATGQGKILNKRIELAGLKKDGSIIPIELSVTPIKTKDSMMCFGFLRDISERKKAIENLQVAKEAAESANRAKSAFLANMSHEIRTPLGVIIGFSELVTDPATTPADRDHFVSSIKRNGALLSGIVNDVLDLSKVEAGKLDVEVKETNLDEILKDVVSAIEPKASEKNVELDIHKEASAPHTIWTDPNRLKQILLNILGNSVKFTDKGKIELRIGTEKTAFKQQALAFTVSDSGIGMSPESAEKLFMPFSQLDPTSTRKFGGAGLGLVLSKRLAKLLGGDVVLVKSETGIGSTFKILIDPGILILENNPAEVRTAQPESTELPVSLEGIKILLAEDSPENQVLVSRFLKKAGAEVDIADNGQIALEKSKEKDYDVLLIDIQMPVLDGYATVTELRKRGTHIPIIALTAHAMAEERQKSLDKGFDEHISKPVDRQALIKSIAHFCRSAS